MSKRDGEVKYFSIWRWVERESVLQWQIYRAFPGVGRVVPLIPSCNVSLALIFSAFAGMLWREINFERASDHGKSCFGH